LAHWPPSLGRRRLVRRRRHGCGRGRVEQELLALVTLVKAAGLTGALSSPNAQLTVFAPTLVLFMTFRISGL
jgi:hypothetical protein